MNAKIYSHIRSNNLIGIIPLDGLIEITENLKWFDEARIDITYINWMLEYNKIQIVDDNNELIFDWIIYQLEPRFDRPDLLLATLRSNKFIFHKREVLVDYSPVSVDVKTILQHMLTEYNSYWEAWILDSDITRDITIELKVGDNLFDSIDELADQCECFWDVVWSTLIFKGSLWIDRSLDTPNYQQIVYDGNAISGTNILNVSAKRIAERANVVVWISKDNTKQILNNITDGFIYWVVKENFRDGDLMDKTQQLLNKVDAYQLYYNVSVQSGSIIADKWDKLFMRIENRIPIFNISSAVRVVSKKTTYDKWEKVEEITVSNLTVSEKRLENVIGWIARKISLITT